MKKPTSLQNRDLGFPSKPQCGREICALLGGILLDLSAVGRDCNLLCRHCWHIITSCHLSTVVETLPIYQASGYVKCRCQFYTSYRISRYDNNVDSIAVW